MSVQEMYVSELQRCLGPAYFALLVEVDGFDGDLHSRVLRTVHDGPNCFMSKDFRDQQAEIECSVQVKRKDE